MLVEVQHLQGFPQNTQIWQINMITPEYISLANGWLRAAQRRGNRLSYTQNRANATSGRRVEGERLFYILSRGPQVQAHRVSVKK